MTFPMPGMLAKSLMAKSFSAAQGFQWLDLRQSRKCFRYSPKEMTEGNGKKHAA
jgi:hypothetical protein